MTHEISLCPHKFLDRSRCVDCVREELNIELNIEKRRCALMLTAANTYEDERDDLKAKLARVEWQPIETAPKDGTLILVYEGVTTKKIWKASWWTGLDCWAFGVTSTDHTLMTMAQNIAATHWMPLPEPPALEQTDV